MAARLPPLQRSNAPFPLQSAPQAEEDGSDFEPSPKKKTKVRTRDLRPCFRWPCRSTATAQDVPWSRPCNLLGQEGVARSQDDRPQSGGCREKGRARAEKGGGGAQKGCRQAQGLAQGAARLQHLHHLEQGPQRR